MNIRESFLLPIADTLQGMSVHKKLMFLRESQYWKREQLVDFQEQRLKELIAHCYKNIPFYRRRFDECGVSVEDIKTIEDLKLLPILTKNEIREGIKSGELIAKNISRKSLIRNSSSGSTGEPLVFYHTKESASMSKASAIRGWNWMNFNLGDKFVKISPLPRNSLLKKMQDKVTRSLYLNVQEFDDRNIAEALGKIANYRPKVLRSYPDPLRFLSVYAEENKIVLPEISAINTTGSTLSSDTREIAERVFKCKIYDSFSCEGGAVVFECETNECYHSAMEYAITEIVDDQGKEATTGRLITTDLWNYATPFIRYDTQDIVELYEDKCSCGRELLPIKRILGRESDVLVTPLGKRLIVNNFTGKFQWLEMVNSYQIRQTEVDTFKLYVVPNEKYDDSSEAVLKKEFFDIVKEDVKLEVVLVENISLEKSGKRRFLIRDKHIPFNI